MQAARSSERSLTKIASDAGGNVAPSKRVALAHTLRSRGDTARAKRLLEHELARRSHDAAVLSELGWLELELGARDAAEARFRAALACPQPPAEAPSGLRAALKAQHGLFARALAFGFWARRPISAVSIACAAFALHATLLITSDASFETQGGGVRAALDVLVSSRFAFAAGCAWITAALVFRRTLAQVLLAASDSLFLTWELDGMLSPDEERHSKRCLAYVVAPCVALTALLLPGHAGALAFVLVLVPIPLYQGSCLEPGLARALFALTTLLGSAVLLGEIVSALFAPGACTAGTLFVAACAWALVSLPLGSALRRLQARRA